jgi:glycosyltransferase involved in cell wall biosynthesis
MINVAAPMNVLFVTGIFPPDRGGPASSVPRMAAALTARGHGVEVICLADHLEHPAQEHPFRVHRIRRGLFWPWRVTVTVFKIWRAAWRHDLVYVHGLGAECALAALLSGRPAVHKIVGDYAWERAVGRGWFKGTLDDYQSCPRGVVLWMLNYIRVVPLKLANQVIVPSRYLRRIVEGWAISSDKITLVYNAVSRAAQPRTEQLPDWSGKTLITVCRLVPWKGVDALIQLLPELVETRLVVAGDGGMRGKLEALADALGVANRVLFLGDVPHQSVRGLLQQADAFVLNSTYEGLPHVVLEAMVAGVPVIATDAGGTGEVVEHNATGLLVPVGDSVALKAAIERLWNDPLLGRQFTSEVSMRLAARFDFDKMVEATEAVLANAAARAEPLAFVREEAR